MIQRHPEQDEQGKQRLPWVTGHPGAGVGVAQLGRAATRSLGAWVYLPLCLPMVVNIVPHGQTKAQMRKEWGSLPALFLGPVSGQPQASGLRHRGQFIVLSGAWDPWVTRHSHMRTHSSPHTHSHTQAVPRKHSDLRKRVLKWS